MFFFAWSHWTLTPEFLLWSPTWDLRCPEPCALVDILIFINCVLYEKTVICTEVQWQRFCRVLVGLLSHQMKDLQDKTATESRAPCGQVTTRGTRRKRASGARASGTRCTLKSRVRSQENWKGGDRKAERRKKAPVETPEWSIAHINSSLCCFFLLWTEYSEFTRMHVTKGTPSRSYLDITASADLCCGWFLNLLGYIWLMSRRPPHL